MSRRRVLIVHNGAIIEDEIRLKLEKIDCELAGITSSLSRTVDLARDIKPDIVLIDVGLTGSVEWGKALEKIMDRHDAPFVCLTSDSDLSAFVRHKKSADDSRKDDAKWKILFENASDNIMIHPIDEDGLPGNYSDVNESTCRTLGYTREELLAMGPRDTTETDDPDMFGKIINEINCTGHSLFEASGKTKDGAVIPFEINAHLIDIDGMKNVIAISRDITERKRAEEERSRIMAELRHKVEEMDAFLSCTKLILTEDNFSNTAKKIFDACRKLIGAGSGYTALLSKDGKNNNLLFLEAGCTTCAVDRSLPMPVRGLRGIAYKTNEVVYENNFAESKWMELMPEGHVSLDNVLFAPLVIENKTVGIMGIANKPGGFNENDARLAGSFAELAAISLSNSAARETIEKSLREKDILLKEVHHRVKNNFQTILSLLNLQTKNIKDKDDLLLYRDTQSRIRSMSLIHEKLYQSESLAKVDFREYISELSSEISKNHFSSAGRILININADEIYLDINRAIPCSLIINELLTNSHKYAFPEGVAGEINIDFQKQEDGNCILSYRDNGTGLPDDFDIGKADSLGLQLVNALTGQLGGRLRVENGNGVGFVITFPVD